MRILAISGHAADFVWRCGGALALHSARGDETAVLALTFGERGESTAAWKNPDATEGSVKEIRKSEAERAAQELGAKFDYLDFGDHPIEMTTERTMEIVRYLRTFRPDIVITHSPNDPLNVDHPLVHETVRRALRLAGAAGVLPELQPLPPAELLGFEPDQPELCAFEPNTYLDISSVFETKLAAMKHMETQSQLVKNYTSRGEYRGYLAGRLAGQSIGYAEAYQRMTPLVASSLDLSIAQ